MKRPRPHPLIRLLVAASLVGLSMVTFRPAIALDLPAWSDDRAGSDTDPATTVATDRENKRLETDASEDGRTLVAMWQTQPIQYRQLVVKGSVGYTDGTATKWTTPVQISTSTTASAYYPTVSMAGDGRTVYVAWIEATVPDTTLDDLFVVTGAISVDLATNTPSVTWSSPQRFRRNNHQWWPSIDSSFDGTKVVMTHWDLGSGGPYLNADVAQVAISGSTRTVTWKGPATMANNANTYNPTSEVAARVQVVVNRDGTRAAASYWYSPNSTGNFKKGTIRAMFGDIRNDLPFPSSLSGSAWSGATNISVADASQNVARSIHMSDDGSRVLLAWGGWDGDAATDKKRVLARVATLSNATTATWETAVTLHESTETVQGVNGNISADGSRVFVGWNLSGYQYPLNFNKVLARVGTTSSSGTTWQPASTLLDAPSSNYLGPLGMTMSREGNLAAAVVLPPKSSDIQRVDAFASTIWSSGGALQTDWNSTAQNLGSYTGVNSWEMMAATPLLSKDGTIITAVWGTKTAVFSRTTRLGNPTVTAVSPSSGVPEGGETLTITGTNFRSGATVTIGGAACTNVVVVSATQITCTTGPGTEGPADVVVTNRIGEPGTGTALFTYVTPITAPLEITNLSIGAPSGQTRTVTLTFNAPANAQTWTLSGFLITYRCLTKTTVSAPCTGKWRLGSSIEYLDDSVTNGQEITHTFQLPAGIAGTAGRPVEFRVIPVADDDEMKLGPTSNIGTIAIRDIPVFFESPLTTRDMTGGRIMVSIAAVPVRHLRGSTVTGYSVEYTRSNKSWFSIPSPAGGWGPGKSRVVAVPTLGEPYYFRLKLTTDSGTVYMNGFKSQISR